ncbi:MAG: Fe-S cluster assembly protein SufD [Cytophagales bacterium]|nr:Fe-S cluster assembly protein SufD [Cytophagales bacterium]
MIDLLKESFRKFENHLNGSGKGHWHQLRKEALSAFSSHGFPKSKDEEYRYTPIGRKLEKAIDFSNIKPIAEHRAQGEKQLFHDADAIHVFINNNAIHIGSLNELDVNGIDILSLNTASKKFKGEVESHFGKYANVRKDSFTALNTAFSYEGIFVKVSKGAVIEKPIILHYGSDDSATTNFFQTRNLILVDPGAHVTIIESYTADYSDVQYSNHVSELVVGENAHVNYYKFQNQGGEDFHIDNSFISQHRDSVVKAYTFTLEGKIVRNNLNISLEEENCEAHMFGLYVVQNDGHVDNHTAVDHKVANCYSNEIYKGILDDNSKGVFNGKIYVRPDAQKTNAFQSNKNILLTDTASANTKPQLEIWADDVSCSHGCTTGQLDEEQLFYLRSRGISQSSAKAMLLHAFVNDVVDKIEIDFLHDFINDEMYNRLD